MRVGLWRQLSTEDLMLLNCGVGTHRHTNAVVLEKTLESPLDSKEIQPVHPKGNQSWIFIGRTDAEAEAPITLASWCDELIPWKRPWFWERLNAGKGDNRGWDGWMVSSTRWTWVWASSGSWWWTGKICVLQSMGLQRVAHDWGTELNWVTKWINEHSSSLWPFYHRTWWYLSHL